MEPTTQPADSPLRDAASVVMLRDGESGLEVFLLKRHGMSDVLAGAYVFPGGKVDPQDAMLDLRAHLDMAPSILHAGLGEPDLDELAATALHVAALREAFEETGVLYARDAHATHAQQAWQLLREGRAFDEVLALMSLRLEVSKLVPWSRWITPIVGGVMRKRFDTRFFLAAVPQGQIAQHDNHEATDSVWLTPRAALQQYWAGTIELAPPQIMGLAHLSRHDSVGAALAQARARTPPVIRPEPFEVDGTRAVCYPGDERHSLSERALPGPTRLVYRNKRLEPADGFEGLFLGPDWH